MSRIHAAYCSFAALPLLQRGVVESDTSVNSNEVAVRLFYFQFDTKNAEKSVFYTQNSSQLERPRCVERNKTVSPVNPDHGNRS